MKKLLLFLLTFSLVAILHAVTATVNGITWTYQVSNGEAEIYSSSSAAAIPTSTSGVITIPSSLGGYPVTSIGSRAFYNCSSLTSVTIPEGVTSIGDGAFRGCSSLTSVTIPSSVTSIGPFAFAVCRGLTSVTIPEGVTSIGDGVFNSCWGLTSVTIPLSVTTIGDYAFSGCSGLTSVHIADLATWCKIAFESSSSNPLTYAEKLYLNGELITNLVIPSSVTTIGNYAFPGCSGLTSVTIPSSVTSIGDYAFSGCTGLTSVTIPSSVTSIGENTFNGCSSLTSVTIPEGVTSIGSSAFSYCDGLTSVTIPSSVTTIGSFAFSNCNGLTSFVVDTNNQHYTAINGLLYSKDGKTLIECPGALTSVTIPSSVTSIGDYAFYCCTGLTSVTIPEGVTSIGSSAFLGCTGLTSVTIPSSVTSIGYSAFSNCGGLTSVMIPEGVTTIGSSAFSGCTGLTSVTIPSSVTSIGDYVFSNCSNLWKDTNGVQYESDAKVILINVPTSLGGKFIIPNSVRFIHSAAFSGCSSLTSVTIPSSVTSIGNHVFSECSNLWKDTNGVQYESAAKVVLIDMSTSLGGEFIIPNSVRFIHSGAFDYCRSLTSVTIPEGVTSIGDYAFYCCSGLTSVTIPSNVTSIGDFAFSNCNGLTSFVVNTNNQHYIAINGLLYSKDGKTLLVCPGGKTSVIIPKGITSVGVGAFFGCGSLKSVVIPEGVTTIGDSAFGDCSVLKYVVLPSSLTSIGDYLFYYSSVEKAIFNGSPPSLGSEYAYYFYLNAAYYDNRYATEWGAAIDSNGTWNSLTMKSGLYDENSHHFWEYTITENGIVITKCTTIGGILEIPTEIFGHPVVAIDEMAIADCDELTSVTIPASVTFIGSSAFSNCTGLTSISFEGEPPALDWSVFFNVSAIGYYSPEYAFEWESVIDSNGEWNGLKMVLQPALIFDANGGEGGQMVTQAPSSVLVAPSVTREGYTFVGWLPKVPKTVPTNPQTYVAQWVTNEDCFEYEVLEGNSIEITGLTKTSLEEVIIPSTIDGLPVTSIGMDAFSDSDQIVSVILPEGIVSIGDYAFYGCSNLKSIELPSTVRSIAISAFEDCETLTRVFFNGEPPSVGKQAFKGLPIEARGVYLSDMATTWEDVIEANGEWNGLTMVVPSALEICITFDANGGEGGTSITQGYATALTALSVARKGYFFAGWSPEVPVLVPMKDTVHKAYWMPKRYTITFDANGGEGSTGAALDYATPLTAPQVMREGYTFVGWSPAVPETVPAENMTYTAQWTPKQYTVTFDANGGDGGTSELWACGSPLTAPLVTREGYSFKAWSPFVPTTVPAENTTYTAQWEINRYTITFNANGGEGGKAVTQDYATPLTAPQVMREGYTFVGWSPAVPETVPAENMTYTAQWTPKQYTITFDANGGEGGTSVTQDCDSELVIPTVSREGYTFAGWLPAVPETVPAENMTYTAQWTINQYTITFDAAGGEGGTSVTQDYASALTAPRVTREGYTFKGWTPAVPSTVPAGNMTYTAQWQVNQYTITFDANGGVGSTTGQFEYGAALIPPRVAHSKYEFMGWLPEVPATVPAGDTTYVAQWGSNPDLFTYDIYENEVTITGFAEGVAIAEIIIPRWIEDLPVTMIGNSAFEGCATLSTVVIPEGVINIGRSAFRNCEGLTHVTLSSSVSNVYAYAFSGCTNLKSIGFCASPIETVGKDAFADITAVGTCLPQYASEWEAVIVDGKWHGLTMVQKAVATLPEGLPDATGEWLTDKLEASGITSGSVMLASGTTVETLDAARLLGITPSISASDSIASVAAESTFEVSEVVVADNAVSLAVTITVEAGKLPENPSLGGVVKLLVCDTLGGDWREVTPDPSQIKLTRISDTEARLSVTQSVDVYNFFKVFVK